MSVHIWGFSPQHVASDCHCTLSLPHLKLQGAQNCTALLAGIEQGKEATSLDPFLGRSFTTLVPEGARSFVCHWSIPATFQRCTHAGVLPNERRVTSTKCRFDR